MKRDYIKVVSYVLSKLIGNPIQITRKPSHHSLYLRESSHALLLDTFYTNIHIWVLLHILNVSSAKGGVLAKHPLFVCSTRWQRIGLKWLHYLLYANNESIAFLLLCMENVYRYRVYGKVIDSRNCILWATFNSNICKRDFRFGVIRDTEFALRLV